MVNSRVWTKGSLGLGLGLVLSLKRMAEVRLERKYTCKRDACLINSFSSSVLLYFRFTTMLKELDVQCD